MASRALLAPPGARRGAAASTPQTLQNSQKPSVHRLGRNKPGMPKLILSARSCGDSPSRFLTRDLDLSEVADLQSKSVVPRATSPQPDGPR